MESVVEQILCLSFYQFNRLVASVFAGNFSSTFSIDALFFPGSVEALCRSLLDVKPPINCLHLACRRTFAHLCPAKNQHFCILNSTFPGDIFKIKFVIFNSPQPNRMNRRLSDVSLEGRRFSTSVNIASGWNINDRWMSPFGRQTSNRCQILIAGCGHQSVLGPATSTKTRGARAN